MATIIASTLSVASCVAPPAKVNLSSKQSVGTSAPSFLKISSKSTRAMTFRCRATTDSATVDYESQSTSVFPAEACDALGGEACEVEGVGPEVKPKASKEEEPKDSRKWGDRDTISYDGDKTVFPGDACDNLGGEFCEPEYQEGVSRPK